MNGVVEVEGAPEEEDKAAEGSVLSVYLHWLCVF